MSFSDAVRSVFSHYSDFSGRARRSEYWYFCLANYLINAVLGWLGKGGGICRTLLILYNLAVIIPGLAVLWRRLHDIGRSGAYSLVFFIPLLGQILLFIRLVTDSERGVNRFGISPKYGFGDMFDFN